RPMVRPGRLCSSWHGSTTRLSCSCLARNLQRCTPTATGHVPSGDGPPLPALAGSDEHGSCYRQQHYEYKHRENAERKNAPMTQKDALLVYPPFATLFWRVKFAL